MKFIKKLAILLEARVFQNRLETFKKITGVILRKKDTPFFLKCNYVV